MKGMWIKIIRTSNFYIQFGYDSDCRLFNKREYCKD